MNNTLSLRDEILRKTPSISSTPSPPKFLKPTASWVMKDNEIAQLSDDSLKLWDDSLNEKKFNIFTWQTFHV